MATSRRRAALTGLTALVLAGCTGSGDTATGPTPAPATTPVLRGTAAPDRSAPDRSAPDRSAPDRSAPPTYGGAVLGGSAGPCKVHTPTAWTSALHRDRLWATRTSTHVGSVPMTDSAAVLSEDDTAGRARIGVRTRAGVQPVVTIARPRGVGSLADAVADRSHVAFVWSTGAAEQAANSWRLYLWNRSGTATAVAANPTAADGTPLPGGYVHPVLTAHALWWIQAARTKAGDAVHAAGSALMRYDLDRRTTTVVHRGLVTSLVAYRGQVLVTAVGRDLRPGPGGNPPLQVRAFDGATGRETPAPAGLTAGPDQPDWMVTNGDVVAWNTAGGAVRGWRASWGRSITLVPELGSWPTAARNRPAMDFPGYPRLLGPLLAFNSTATFVLDLRSNSFVQLTTHHGGMEAAGRRLAMWQYVTDEPPAYGQGLTTTQWVLDTAGLPTLPRCSLR